MFNDPYYSYEAILQRMLDGAPPGIDTREGSIFYDSRAPAAAELAEAYIELQNVLELVFADSSNGVYLEKRVKEQGIYAKVATQTIRHVATTGSGVIREGQRFLVEDVFFVSLDEKAIPNTFAIKSEEVGSHTIVDINSSVIPVNTIDGLKTISLVAHEDDVNGVDKESDSSILTRYLETTKQTPASGNVADYERWTKEVVGVGDVNVVPLWNGAGTVKLIVLDANRQPANAQLLDDVKLYVDPVDGQGEGKAPIGATVTVEAAVAKTIFVSVTVEFESTTSLAELQPVIEKAISDYLSKTSLGDLDEIRINKIGSIILGVAGVIDYSTLTLNDATVDVVINANEVPVLGAVTLS